MVYGKIGTIVINDGTLFMVDPLQLVINFYLASSLWLHFLETRQRRKGFFNDVAYTDVWIYAVSKPR